MCTCVVSFWEEQSLHREVWCVCVWGGCCYKWHVVCAGVEGWHTRMWDDGDKLIPHRFQFLPSRMIL